MRGLKISIGASGIRLVFFESLHASLSKSHFVEEFKGLVYLKDATELMVMTKCTAHQVREIERRQTLLGHGYIKATYERCLGICMIRYHTVLYSVGV